MMYYSILDEGAQTNHIATAAVQAAIDKADATHGTVLIPAGTYVCGTLNLKGASLYLEKGAVLKASDDMRDYSSIGYRHNEMGDVTTFLFCMDQQDILISGHGFIDLNGDAFFHMNQPCVPDTLIPMTPSQESECTRAFDDRPNQPMFFLRCKHVAIKDIEIRNAPSWTMSFIECTDVRITDLTIDNSLLIPNNDGMHFCCCEDVSVRGCHISTGDDCIALTCLTNWDKPCQRITVSDCVLRSASKAISIGYMHSIVRDVVISNCVITQSNRGLVIMASSGTGLVENVLLANLRLDTRIYAGNWWGNGEPICLMANRHDNPKYFDASPSPRFQVGIRHIRIQNVACTGENAIAVIGENQSVRDVSMRHFSFRLTKSVNLSLKGRMIDLAPGIQNAFFPNDENQYWLFLRDAKDIHFADYSLEGIHGETLAAFCDQCKDCTLSRQLGYAGKALE